MRRPARKALIPRRRDGTGYSGSWEPPVVEGIREGSPLLGAVFPGDRILELNGSRPRDVVDFLTAAAERRTVLLLQREGRVKRVRIRKDEGIPLGLIFSQPVFDGVMTCRNRCIFCFVDRLPPGLRPGLYLKDDDYRLSFLFGNFVTLNNLGEGEVRRILDLRLSPLYVSLHSTDAALRSLLMGGNGERGLQVLKELTKAGISVHLQVVVCPGYNDGQALERTLSEALDAFRPASLALVPLGLAHAEKEKRLRLPARDDAFKVLQLVRTYRERAQEEAGEGVVQASDEFYLLAGERVPPAEDYEGYPQLENGVGMVRKFLDEVEEERARLKDRARVLPGTCLLTGGAFAPLLEEALEGLPGALPGMIVPKNRLFGDSVTVTALLGGEDVVAGIRESQFRPERVLLPDSLLCEGRFLDGKDLQEVEEEAGTRLVTLPVRGEALVRALAGIPWSEEEEGSPVPSGEGTVSTKPMEDGERMGYPAL